MLSAIKERTEHINIKNVADRNARLRTKDIMNQLQRGKSKGFEYLKM